ncbi:hypothetical protein IJ843_06590 [bacterium]|nr:hypothetical protein [bacterium]
MVSQVSSATAAQATAAPASTSSARHHEPAYYRRKEELDSDTVEFSSKKKDDGEKGFFAKTFDTIGNAASKFVEITANAFSKAAAEVVVDKAVGKISGK